MSKTKKRPEREIEKKRNADHRRQQKELLERYDRRRNYPQPEDEWRYRP